MKKYLLIALAFVLLAGCATQMKYTPPVIPKPEKIPTYVLPLARRTACCIPRPTINTHHDARRQINVFVCN